MAPTFDNIDQDLLSALRATLDDELDFVINCDIKIRVGGSEDADD